jgi:DNA-directed RNA polymerase subunit M/transcription elongation factor TFIIS
MASLLEQSFVRCPFCTKHDGRLLQKDRRGSEVLQTFHCATCQRTWETTANPFFVELLTPVKRPSRATCPNCQSAEGHLRGMTTGAGGGPGWFTFVCNDCRHSWKRSMQRDTQPLETGNAVRLTPKADRRKGIRPGS